MFVDTAEAPILPINALPTLHSTPPSQQQVCPPLPQSQPNKSSVVTPIKADILAQFLSNYHLAQYLVQGFTTGVKLLI